MKNFETIKKLVNDFTAEVDKAKKALDEQLHTIYRDFNVTGGLYPDKVADAKQAYANLVQPMLDNTIKQVEQEYADIVAAIEKVVTTPCSIEVLKNLEFIRNVGLSDTELKLYFEKYHNSYTAKKILHDIADSKYPGDTKKPEGLGDTFIPADAVLEDIDGVKEETVWAIKHYEGKGEGWYRMANFLSFSRLDRVAALFNEFVTGYSVE